MISKEMWQDGHDLTPEKYDICISVVVVISADSGKVSVLFLPSIIPIFSQTL
jgi:hypothetical protein